MKNNKEKKRYTISFQFIKFACVGVSNAVMSYTIYIVAMIILNKMQYDVEKKYLIAQLMAFVLCVAWSFIWNERFVFGINTNSKKDCFISLLKAYASYSITGLFLNSLLLFLWIDVIGISEVVGPLINMVINVPVSFLMNKYWVYKSE